MSNLIHYFFLFILYFFVLFPIWQKKTKQHLFLHTTMFIYILTVLTITVIPLPNFFHIKNSALLYNVNLIPFRDIINGYTFAKREALLNVLLMIPFGFLFPIISGKRMFITVVATFIFSLMIETIQLMTILVDSVHKRTPDITDIITNTSGGLIGYILFYMNRFHLLILK